MTLLPSLPSSVFRLSVTSNSDKNALLVTTLPSSDRRPQQFYSAGLYNGNSANSHFVEDGTYARLRELSVSYNFDPGMLNRVGLGVLSQGMKLSIVGRNLLTWTSYSGFDPEANSGGDFNFRIDGFRYPNFRTVTAMIDVSF